MGSSMTKSRQCEYSNHRYHTKDVGNNYSKEYNECWKQPKVEKTSNFSMEKNDYSYCTSEDFSPNKNATRYTNVVSSFR